jgi:hypothetical protein
MGRLCFCLKQRWLYIYEQEKLLCREPAQQWNESVLFVVFEFLIEEVAHDRADDERGL